ncbi:MAG TPA: GYF domain-containing protein [Bdellovibrionota bacterium]|nr:GYF domain-containing protein [Bdellovibrionota bacterium]
MENTGNILFEDNIPQWYVAFGDHWVGPLTASDVYQKVVDQEITFAHYVWKPGQADWRRICDIKTFQSAVPQLPQKDVQHQVEEAAKPAVKQVAGRRSAGTRQPGPPVTPPREERMWFLYYNESQFGPFTTEEIKRYLRIGKIHGRVFAWKNELPDWVRLENIETFSEAVAASVDARKKAKNSVPPKAPKSDQRDQNLEGFKPEQEKLDQRAAPRRPLVAKIVMAHNEAVSVGICRDISVGGLQVLTDKLPGTTGQKVKMNVSDAAGKIQSFVAEGVIARVLEDRRGFSFRFEKLSDSARRAIEAYIHAEGA